MRLLMAAASIKANRPDEAAKLLAVTEKSRPPAGQTGLVILQALGQPSDGLDPDEAALAKLLSADPGTLSTFALASACQAAQLHDAAYDLFRKLEPTLGENPDFLRSMFASLARCLRLEKPEDEARSLAERHAGGVAAWLGWGGVARALDDAKAEREALDKAIAVDPKDPDVWFQLGQYEERQKDIKAAGEAYKKLAETRPDDPFAKNNAAYCLLMTGGDAKEALDLAEKAKEKLPTNASVLHTLGVAQLRTGNLEESQKNLAMALELRPGDPTLLLDFGLLLVAQNHVEEGKADIDLALRYADQLGLDFPRREEAAKALEAAGK
jgi:tetratricopeptide (TPR) repeat protein